MIPLLDLQAQYEGIRAEILAAVKRVLESQQFILGPEVEAFESEIAAYCQAPYAIGVSSGSDALLAALMALGVGPGDEVILPECTWIASGAGVTYLGATPVFCDIEPENWCLSPESVANALTPRTKAIIVVDLFGNMPRMEALIEISEKHGIPLIEDAAEALGSVYRGIRAGKFGIGSVFSFHRTKTITTGEGGMLLLDDEDLYDRCMFLRDHGRRPGGPMYYNYEVTYKYMPFNVQAALGYAQFQRINDLVGRKRQHLTWYRERLADVPDLQLNPEPEGGVNGAWITGLVFGKSHSMTKQQAMDDLAALGVPARPFFYPLSCLPAYPGYREQYQTRNPNAYDISNRGVNLPGAFTLTEEQADFVCAGIRKILGC